MDDPTRLSENVPGKYYTTVDCDGCAYCAAVAPDNFEFNKPTNTYFVGKQPVDSEETELVLDAMADCPLDAIRSAQEEVTVSEENEHGNHRG